MSCPVKIRPLPNDTEIGCELSGAHREHSGLLSDYAYPGSGTRVSWLDSDRRCFTGDWVECPEFGCLLPANHPRGHAR